MMYIAPSVLLGATAYTLRWPLFLWNNLVTASGITPDYADASYPATNLANPQTSSVYKSTSLAVQNIVFSVSPTQQIDAVGIARHNFGSGAVGVKIYGITADVGAVFTLLADLVPGDDSPILAVVASGYYVQIKITLTPVAVIPQAAVVYIGTSLRMIRGVPPGFTPPTDALQTDMLAGIAENGDFLGDIIVSQRRSSAISFKLLDAAWYRANVRPFLQARVPFFSNWAPLSYPLEVGYSKFDGNPTASISQVTGDFDVSFNMTSLAR
jgi:hypothetical protein